MRTLVVTSASSAAPLEVLRRSLLAVHPGAEVVELRCDARPPRSVGGTAVSPAGEDLGGYRWADFVLALGERAAGWAALPWVLDRLDGDRPLLVLDDGFVAFGSLDPLLAGTGAEVVARARRVHATSGTPWGGLQPGVVVLAGSGATDLEWWRSRAIAAVTGQQTVSDDGASGPWWDARDGVALRTDAGLRVAPDVEDRFDLRIADGGYTVDGQPLRLADLGGLDPREPWWFARGDGPPRHLTSSSDGLRRLCEDVAGRLLAAGWSPPPEDMLLPGLPATAGLRRWYRSLLADSGPDALPPNPYVPGEVDDFVALLRDGGGTDGSGLSAHLDLALEERPDVLAAFPHHRWRDREGLRRWAWSSGLRERDTSLLTLPAPPTPVAPARGAGGPRPFGVNLVGYLGADLGLGVAARQMRRALEAAGVPTATVSYDRTSSNVWGAAPGHSERPYHFNLMVIVPDQLPLFVDDVGPGFLQERHNIGLWYWECDTLTGHQREAFAHVDEVWAPTTYLEDVFARERRVPVTRVPSPLVFEQTGDLASARSRLGLDDRFTYLFSFDFLSVVARKNPAGLAEAYRRAFPDPDGGTRLVLKSINGSVFPREREQLAAAISDRPDIELWDRLLPGRDRLALVAAADCYVSLHRSEGLGLTMAEAMSVGTPVIASAYSGNLDFMDDSSALLVPVEEVEVGTGNYYPPHGHWAEPDLDRAAELMQQVRADADLRDGLTQRAGSALAGYSYDEVGRTALGALLAAWERRAR